MIGQAMRCLPFRSVIDRESIHMSRQLPPLNLHAHINPYVISAGLERLGAVVFAAIRSLDEYESVRNRDHQVTI